VSLDCTVSVMVCGCVGDCFWFAFWLAADDVAGCAGILPALG
jgi:hypothetical protein